MMRRALVSLRRVNSSIPEVLVTHISCWCCQIPIDRCQSFCPYCGKITDNDRPRASGIAPCNHFELLGLDASGSFMLDSKDLEQRYRKLAMKLHPDRFANAPKREQELSAMHAARLNGAYQTLKSPLRRAIYLLDLQGVKHALGEDEEDTHRAPTNLSTLTETMELREQVEDANTEKAQIQLLEEVESRILEVERELACAIGDPQLIDLSVSTAVRLRFLEKVREELKEKISGGPMAL